MNLAIKKTAGIATVKADSMIAGKIAVAVSIKMKLRKLAQNATAED